MDMELAKMAQFFAERIGNEDQKYAGLNKHDKTEIGLRVFEAYGLAKLVKKRPFSPFWRPTKKLTRDLKTAGLLLQQRNLKAAATLLSSLAVSKGKVPAQVTVSGWRRQHERYARHFRQQLNLKYLLFITISAGMTTMQQKGHRRETIGSTDKILWEI
jgi:hypothetical protein